MRFHYVLSEIMTGLRRNLTMTLAVVITVAISMGFLGTGLLVRAQASTMKDYWYDKIEISVFMCNEFDKGSGCAEGQVTDGQKAQIEQTLTAHPQVRQVFLESQEQAYERFQEQFQDSIAETITPDQLQESFRVELRNPEEYEAVVSAVAGLPGVHQIVDQREVLEPFFDVLNSLQVVAAVISAIMVVAAVLLIANTIRLAAFSRRRETGIMRLVGASNFYIQLPFILEAAIAGVIGALLAACGIVLVKWLFIDGQMAQALRFVAWVDWADTLRVLPWLMVAGIGLTAIAAFVTLRRYLRV
jgi:cell division transport system permease protein